jgi:general secretion pathway protein G
MKNKQIIKKNMKKAFSLMELMVVIIILGLLAAFVLPSLTGKSDDAKNKLTCVQMKSIDQALKMYKIDNSTYPTTEEGLKKLIEKNYFENNKMPLDSWKSKYIYINDEDGKIDLISFGANKKEGGGDDIYYSKCK